MGIETFLIVRLSEEHFCVYIQSNVISISVLGNINPMNSVSGSMTAQQLFDFQTYVSLLGRQDGWPVWTVPHASKFPTTLDLDIFVTILKPHHSISYQIFFCWTFSKVTKESHLQI